MSAPGFSPDSVPTFNEAEARASHEAWERLAERRLWARIVGCAVVSAVVLVSTLLWLNGGEFA
ncbi:hypothetical protein [Micromonospora profundi]|uniref:hypothetical protein n=1 Tax=Micromonospora profundi TaxID=1420889 RepID=UPI003654B86F